MSTMKHCIPRFLFINRGLRARSHKVQLLHVRNHRAKGCGPSHLNYIKGYMEPIGTMIREELERQERTVAWLARKLNCDRSNVYRLFQKHSIDTALLQRLSVILGRDFFSDLSDNFSRRKESGEA